MIFNEGDGEVHIAIITATVANNFVRNTMSGHCEDSKVTDSQSELEFTRCVIQHIIHSSNLVQDGAESHPKECQYEIYLSDR